MALQSAVVPLTSTLGRDLSDEFFDGDLLKALLADNLLAVLLELIPPAAL